jgi:hypothetical protein
MKPVTLRSLSRPVGAVVLAFLLGLIAGCDSGGSTARPPDARPLEPTSQDFGDVEVHYNAMLTGELTPEVARAYGIERSGNRVLLNVSMLRKEPTGKTTPVDGTVSASARNLNGQLKGLQMRRIQDGPSIYFIGEIGISGNEIIVFDIDATPSGGGNSHAVQFKREFYAD